MITLRQRKYLPLLVYAIGALLVLLAQTAPRLFPAVFNFRPVPLIAYVVCVALLEGARTGAAIGTIAGLLWGVYSFRLFGLDAFILGAIGLTVGLLVERYFRANFLSAMVLCAAAALVQALLEWVFYYLIFLKEDLLSVLIAVYLPNCLYTMVLAPIIYWVVLQITQRLRRMGKR